MGSAGPFAWWMLNIDLMVMCHVISLFASGIVIFIKEARGSSVIVAVMSSLLFTALGIPYLVVQHKWEWTALSVVSALIGFGSMTLAYSAMRIAETLQKRAEKGAASWGGDRFPPLGSDGADVDREKPR